MTERVVMSGRGRKVDYKNLLKNQQEKNKRIRWRTLRYRLSAVEIAQIPAPFAPDRRISTNITGAVKSLDDALVVHIFGYACYPGGPWFGYTHDMLPDVPCAHCGQVNIFGPGKWPGSTVVAHMCPGWLQGKQLPCEADHPCKGQPSMSLAPMWRSCDWIEMEFGSGDTPLQEGHR